MSSSRFGERRNQPMSSRPFRIRGACLIFLGIYLNVPFSILNAAFNYPQILREPTGQVLLLFKEGGAGLIATWYAFALAAVFLIVAVLLVQRTLMDKHKTLLSVATVFGVLAGVFQVLGLIRWVFLVPVLADAYAAPDATEATKAAAVMVFNGFHQYAGVAIGEHLGQLSTSLWAMLISVVMFRSPIYSKWQGASGVAIAVLMLLGLLEGFATVIKFDPGVFAVLTPLSFVALSIWLISLGVVLLLHKEPLGVLEA
jgi:Domain of unknown function (DUF4386)